jgi:hypothetical protein
MQVAKLQSKVHQEQAGKLKKITNPRPFKLKFVHPPILIVLLD